MAHSSSVRPADTASRRARGALKRILPSVIFAIALAGAGHARAETWVDIPGAEDCRVDTDSTAYDTQADVVAFRYVCGGSGVSAIAISCNENLSWRAEGASSPGLRASPGASYIDWLAEFLRAPTRGVPLAGRYTAPTPIERGTPIGRGRDLVCASKDRYRPFTFTGVR